MAEAEVSRYESGLSSIWCHRPLVPDWSFATLRMWARSASSTPSRPGWSSGSTSSSSTDASIAQAFARAQ